jgi:hypothetical protein
MASVIRLNVVGPKVGHRDGINERMRKQKLNDGKEIDQVEHNHEYISYKY